MIPSSFQTGTSGTTASIDWTVHEPATPYNRAVVILYGSDGLAPKWEPEITRHAKALSAAGILAVIPDYFQKSPAVSHDDSSTVLQQAIERHAEWAQVCRDAVAAAESLPPIQSARVGLLGFSLGGFLALRIRDSVNVLVEYFAPFLIGLGANANPSLKVHIHHGDADNVVPLPLNADPIKSALKGDGSTVTHTYYAGANHGFWGGDTANSDARNASCTATTSFFSENL